MKHLEMSGLFRFTPQGKRKVFKPSERWPYDTSYTLESMWIIFSHSSSTCTWWSLLHTLSFPIWCQNELAYLAFYLRGSGGIFWCDPENLILRKEKGFHCHVILLAKWYSIWGIRNTRRYCTPMVSAGADEWDRSFKEKHCELGFSG
jgi:hypothetical protein